MFSKFIFFSINFAQIFENRLKNGNIHQEMTKDFVLKKMCNITSVAGDFLSVSDLFSSGSHFTHLLKTKVIIQPTKFSTFQNSTLFSVCCQSTSE